MMAYLMKSLLNDTTCPTLVTTLSWMPLVPDGGPRATSCSAPAARLAEGPKLSSALKELMQLDARVDLDRSQ